MRHDRTFAVVLIRRLDGKMESSFAYRACVCRTTVAHLLVHCNVAGIAWLDNFSSRIEAEEFLQDATKQWR